MYILYRFPSFYGSPKEFKYFMVMVIYALLFCRGYVCEYKDVKTGHYHPYWMCLTSSNSNYTKCTEELYLLFDWIQNDVTEKDIEQVLKKHLE